MKLPVFQYRHWCFWTFANSDLDSDLIGPLYTVWVFANSGPPFQLDIFIFRSTLSIGLLLNTFLDTYKFGHIHSIGPLLYNSDIFKFRPILLYTLDINKFMPTP